MFRCLLVIVCLFGAANAFNGLRGKGQQKMQPEMVARALTQIELKWMDEAVALRACDTANSTEGRVGCEAAQRSFLGSCQKITEAVVQGSEGDKGDAQEYMENVCAQKEMRQETPQKLCSAFANALVDGMSADSYSNRESLDTRKLCAKFLEKGELRAIAEEELIRQEREEARIEEEKRKKREEEAKLEEEQRKAEEAKRIAEEAERARQEAAEKKAKAEAAKAEQEEKAREAQKKTDELKAAEQEAHDALERVQNMSSTKVAMNKNVTENATKVVPQKSVTKAAEHKKGLSLVKTESCEAKQHGARSMIQEKLAMFGVQCEEMCKEMGVYPKCQCPGFAGQPADADDNRACIAKNCQDPSSPCPNDAFMTCVKETTKVSTLQWDALIQKFDVTMSTYIKSLAAAKANLVCPAPLFVAEGQFCVCKDPENCPSTAETLTPEQAAKLAAEAHTWNQSGAPGTR